MKIPGKYYIQSSACKNSKHQSQLPCWVARRKQGPSKRLAGMDNLIIYKLQNLGDERLWGLLSVILNSDFFSSLGGFKIFLRCKYLSVRKWMIGLTLLTDNTQITTKNWSKNKFQPTFNVKVYLTTKTDKIILSQHITDLLTPTSHSPQLSAHTIKGNWSRGDFSDLPSPPRSVRRCYSYSCILYFMWELLHVPAVWEISCQSLTELVSDNNTCTSLMCPHS